MQARAVKENRKMRMFLVGAVAASLMAIPAVAHAQSKADPSCTLSSIVLGGTSVIQIDATGLHHNANYEIDWVEPLMTQTEYMWSTSKGELQDTVLDDQGSGTYTANLLYLGSQGGVWETSCSLTV
jgi:hypothetical protein